MGKQYTTAPILVNSNGDPIPQYLDITDKTDSPQGTFKPLTNETIQKVQLTGSNVELIKEWLNIPVPAGSLVAYDSNDVSSFSKIIPCFREINEIAHSNSFGLNWRAYGSTANSIGETILDTGTRKGGGSLIEVKGKAVQLVIRNLDTVSRTYNIFLLGRRL